MAEFDQIFIGNPTNEEYIGRYNGENYTLKAGEEITMPHFLGRHLAKHLSDKMLGKEFLKIQEKRYKDNPGLQDPKKYQYLMLDNPHRRIALYKILKSKEEVERTIKAYPQFKVTVTGKNQEDVKYNFVGEMKVYDDYVANLQPKSSEEVVEESPVEVKKPGRPKTKIS